nr:transposase family protein [Gloeothece verrucosa]
MDFHLDTLLNLPDISVFTCYRQEDFTFLDLHFLNPKVKCKYCQYSTDNIHQERPILVRDLSICGQAVYLKISRRQIYCPFCKKYSTESLDFVEQGRNYTKRYENYIYERVKELTVEQVSYHEQLSAEQVKNIFSRIAQRKKKTGQTQKD